MPVLPLENKPGCLFYLGNKPGCLFYPGKQAGIVSSQKIGGF
ncbi:MAG: hypothetical protein ACPGWR_30895 [Ardenticatenaceae bacterium]